MIDFLVSEDGLMGGTEKQVVEIINRLDRNKFDLYLILLKQKKHKSLLENLHCRKKFVAFTSFKNPIDLKKIFNLVFFLKREKIEILHVFFPDSHIVGVFAGKMAGIPKIISSRRDMGYWHTKSTKWFFYLLKNFIQKVLVNSNSIKEYLIKKENIKPSKIEHISNGIDLEEINKMKAQKLDLIKNASIVIGFVGNFNRTVKRIDIFVNAAMQIAQKYKDALFLVVGGGQLDNDLVNLINKNRTSNNLYFLGKVSNAIPYIKLMDIGVNCSDSEGFSNSIMEFMACKKPVVATVSGGNKDLVQHKKTGILVQPDNIDNLVQALIYLIEHKDKRKEFGENAYKYLKRNNDWNEIIKKYERFYLHL